MLVRNYVDLFKHYRKKKKNLIHVLEDMHTLKKCKSKKNKKKYCEKLWELYQALWYITLYLTL